MNNMEKYNLITKNLKEIDGDEKLKNILKNRNLKIYWGTAPTGKIHIGYFVPMLKLVDFLNADCELTILIADLHAFLDNLKTSQELCKLRTKYYTEMIKAMLLSLGVSDEKIQKIKFVIGSEFQFQLGKEYIFDMYKAHTIVTSQMAHHAGGEVVKQSKNPPMTGLMYPTLQALDEEYLKVDAQFGGVDQRKIFMHAKELLPKLGYISRIHLMNPMLPALSKTVSPDKMSSSILSGKIELLDSEDNIKKIINKTYCLEGDITSSLFVLIKNIILPHGDFIITKWRKSCL